MIVPLGPLFRDRRARRRRLGVRYADDRARASAPRSASSRCLVCNGGCRARRCSRPRSSRPAPRSSATGAVSSLTPAIFLVAAARRRRRLRVRHRLHGRCRRASPTTCAAARSRRSTRSCACACSCRSRSVRSSSGGSVRSRRRSPNGSGQARQRRTSSLPGRAARVVVRRSGHDRFGDRARGRMRMAQRPPTCT